MPKIQVLNQVGEKVKDLKLADSVFKAEVNNQAMFDAVILSQANARQDTSKVKTRDEVSGGGKKPWRQKGTGRARQGSTRAPQWRHGGIVFGPNGEQNHEIKMNKKVRQLALRSILTKKFEEKELIVVDCFKFEEIKTKKFVEVLKAIKATGKTLVVNTYDSMDDNSFMSACNIPTIGMLDASEINVYDIMNSKTLVLTEDAVKKIEEVLEDGKDSK